MTEAAADEVEGGQMTFWEHLNELRSRIIKIAIAFILGAVLAWVFKSALLEIIVRPFVEGWNDKNSHATIHFPHPAALFLAYVKLSLLGGFIVSLPITLYQLWAFIAPGLYAKEKRFAIPFVGASCALFAGGGFFGWKVAFPLAFQYLLGFANEPVDPSFEVKPTVMIGDYIEFITRMLLAFGAVFEVPVVVFFLSVIGVINHKHLIKFARYFVVIAFILGAIITPPDPLSQLLLAGPLCVLYCISILIAWVFGKKETSLPS